MDVVAVARAAPYQAAHLRKTTPFPLLLDPTYVVQKALGTQRQSMWRFWFNVRGWWRYLVALLRHRRQGRFTGSARSLPAVAIVGPGGDVEWLYQGRSVADYPTLKVVLAQLAEQAKGAAR